MTIKTNDAQAFRRQLLPADECYWCQAGCVDEKWGGGHGRSEFECGAIVQHDDDVATIVKPCPRDVAGQPPGPASRT